MALLSSGLDWTENAGVVVLVVFIFGLAFALTPRVAAGAHTTRDIDPDEPANMKCFVAFEYTQAAVQNRCLNDTAPINMRSMLVTMDTSHAERSQLNSFASVNM